VLIRRRNRVLGTHTVGPHPQLGGVAGLDGLVVPGIDEQRKQPAALCGIGHGDQQGTGPRGVLSERPEAVGWDGAVAHPSPVGAPLGDGGEQRCVG
jgi:hypothetical protein